MVVTSGVCVVPDLAGAACALASEPPHVRTAQANRIDSFPINRKHSARELIVPTPLGYTPCSARGSYFGYTRKGEKFAGPVGAFAMPAKEKHSSERAALISWRHEIHSMDGSSPTMRLCRAFDRVRLMGGG